ncbi:hypothetical protein [Pararobbsia alpina]|uniref:hypothetical protein n=1 Tax=Pararobbsia alpina TaxID=621374 RepID=UPI0039A56E9A
MHETIEDREVMEVITHLDERANLEATNIDGRRAIVIHNGYGSRHLFGIEKFVKAIQRGRKGGFIEETARYSGIKIIRELYLGATYYQSVNHWIEQYSNLYCYSARVQAFYDVCKAMGLIGKRNHYFGEPGEIARSDGARYMDAFNMLIEAVNARCLSREFKEAERLRRLNAERNEENVLAMEEEMFSEQTGRSRWLLLSLTLRYKPRYRRWITPKTIQQHRERFFAARRYNQLMAYIGNYVWAIEQGENTGLHLHVILFYSGEHNHDEFIAKQIGEYWANEVTGGKGDYWNSNQEWLKRHYKRYGHGIGVGQINWNDRKARWALRENLVYLAKSEQYLMSRSTERIRTFDMGQVPKKQKRGRPRAKNGSAAE